MTDVVLSICAAPRRTDSDARAAWSIAALIAGQPFYRVGRWIGERFQYPRPRTPLPITSVLPAAPAAVLIHGADGQVRTLCVDLDTSRALQAVVDADAQELARLFDAAGLRIVEDRSPSGGRHLYVPLQQAIDASEARGLVEALALRAPSLDPGPHQNITDGCIRVPGSAHKIGGHQMLVTPLSQAQDVLTHRNPPTALCMLRSLLAPELHRVEQRRRVRRSPSQGAGTPQLSSMGVALSSSTSPLRTVARTGLYDTTRYPSDSEARMAVLNHFAACRWTLDQVRTGMANDYSGLAALYGSKAVRLLPLEWAKAETRVHAKTPSRSSQAQSVRKYDTSRTELTGGSPHVSSAPSSPSIHQLVNDLENVLYALYDYRLKNQGRVGISLRFLLRAVLVYMRTNQTNTIDIGCRSFAVALGKNHDTIARLLPALEALSGGMVRRVSRGRGRLADAYVVQLPDDLSQLARQLTWRKGKIHAIRPVFRVLGDVAALTYEAIERGRYRLTTTDLVRTTGISRTAVSGVLTHMEALQMIRRHHGTWEVVAATNLSQLADRLGASQDREEQINRYRRERAAWHAWLDRHLMPSLQEHELYDAEADQYWLPPTDDEDEHQRSLWRPV